MWGRPVTICLVAICLAACGGGGGGEPVTPDVPAGACGPGTCDGCCFGDVCFAGDAASACGGGGQTCAMCAAGAACADQTCGGDACQGVSESGTCTSPTTVTLCAASTGNGSTELASYTCQIGEECRQTAGGAACVLVAGCRDGETRCAGTAVETCIGGSFQTTACSAPCIASVLGAACGLTEPTQLVSGVLRYERRAPNTARTDWAPAVAVPAEGFPLVVARLDGAGKIVALADAGVTAAGGAFSVNVPTNPTSSDVVIVAAVGQLPDAGGTPVLAYAVADPRLAPSPTPHALGETGAAPSIWQWAFSIAAAATGVITIDEASFSGAAHVFDNARRVATSLRARFASFAPVLLWLAPSIDWRCGTCQWGVPASRFLAQFANQIFIRADGDEQYWSDSVLAHELGHAAMAVYGHAVGEGGRHCLGVPSAPGLAWSEGYATWFSADVRGDPVYVDKQQGTMFELDISQRTSGNIPWPRPAPAGGLEQDIYENEIAAILWDLATTQGLGRAPLDAALASPRMTSPPFERGYTRQTWSVSQACERVAIGDSGVSTTFVADFLDALVCNGASPAAIDGATDSLYPYPSAMPLCRP